MGIGESCEGAKHWPQRAECRCNMRFIIEWKLKMREQLHTLERCEGGWEKSYQSGRTPFWKTWIEVRLFLRHSPLPTVWVAKEPLRCFLMLLEQFILPMRHGFSRTVSVLLENVILHWHLHHSPLSRTQWRDNIRISQNTARWWFGNRAGKYSNSSHSWNASRPFSSPVQWWFQLYGSRLQKCVYRSRATFSLDTYLWYSTIGQRSSRIAH